MKNLFTYYILAGIAFTIFSCKSLENKNELPKQTNYQLVNQKKLKDKHSDITGIVYSDIHQSFWVQKQSENEPYLFLIDMESGEEKDKIFIRGTALNWQGIASSSNKHTIHIGDIGDPSKSRKRVQIYSFEELNVKDHFVVPEIRNYTYPDGPRNAKAMIYHPKTKEYFIFTYSDTLTEVYCISSKEKKGVLKKVGELNLTKMTDIQLSPDEREVLVVSDNKVEVFNFKHNKDFITTLNSDLPKYTKSLTNSLFQTACFYGVKNDICYLTYNPIKKITYFTLEQKVDSY